MFDQTFLLLVAVGFAAQLVDGALGMAYGLTATSILLSLGHSPAVASASVHLAETVTTGISAGSHHFARNVDWLLVRRLAIAGSLGGIAGAWLLSSGAGEILRPAVSAYLAIMGGLILIRGLSAARPPRPLRRLWMLGGAGGFLDAIGGGGWGPIVSSALVLRGAEPRRMIGSSVAAEFFVTIAVTVTFIGHLGFGTVMVNGFALVLGGAPAAPLAAILVRHAPQRLLMVLVGLLVLGLGLWGVYRVLPELRL